MFTIKQLADSIKRSGYNNIIELHDSITNDKNTIRFTPSNNAQFLNGVIGEKYVDAMYVKDNELIVYVNGFE